MTRPLISKSLAELKDLQSIDNSRETQASILDELSHRSTKGAKKLSKLIYQNLNSPKENSEIGLSGPPSIKLPIHERKKDSSTPGPFTFTPAKPKFALTEEQREAVDLFRNKQNLKITAFAGTGKTSTLVAMAGTTPSRGIYLAFNKSIADEARAEFPSQTDCRTTHSLARRSVQSSYNFSNQNMFNKIGPKQLAEELDLKEKAIANKVSLTGVQQAHMILTSIRNYCQSEDSQLSSKHVKESGRLLGLQKEEKLTFRNQMVDSANSVWEKMCDPENEIPLGHDGYLKIWSNSNPQLDHDYILLDEAQDTNPAVTRILKSQSAQLILVGDSHQQIYSWRGAEDAMEKFSIKNKTYLTQSFRFGNTLAEQASQVLAILGEQKRLSGNGNINTTISQDGPVNSILTRTNASVIEHTLSAIENSLKPHIVGGVNETKRLVSAVYDLKKGIPSSHPDFYGFSSWNDVIEFSESEEGEEIRTFVNLVQQHGEKRLYGALKSSEPDESTADIVVSTAHKAKGRQWRAVRISDDFGGINTEDGNLPLEEIRLFYVAITRAKETLVISQSLLTAYKNGKIPIRN